MKQELKDKALEILNACNDLTIATNREDGFPQATTVSFVHDGLELFFGVGATSQKAKNIRRDPRVSLAITPAYDGWDNITGISMAAEAEEITLPAELERIGKLMLERFPQIAEFEPPEDLAAVYYRLTPKVMSVLDYSKGFGHTDTVTVDNYDVATSLESMQHKWLVPAA